MRVLITYHDSNVPYDAILAAEKDDRITSIHVYPDGWVANSYRWPKMGRKLLFQRDHNGKWQQVSEGKIDMKRANGTGPLWVAFSCKGGRLNSGQ